MRSHVGHNNGMLYPLLIIAAISVIIFSAFGVATMLGWLPRPQAGDLPSQGTPSVSGWLSGKTMPQIASRSVSGCSTCGVVETINAVEEKGQGSGLGMVAGGITGALIGSRIGNGNGQAVATVAGGAGGAYVGNEIEKNAKKTIKYQVRVRMDDGTYKTTYQSARPPFAVGDKVKVVNEQVRPVPS